MKGSHDLLLFPCSASKKGVSLPSTLRTRRISDFLSAEASAILAEGQERAFSRKGTRIDRRSVLRPALALYTGNPYKVSGFRACILSVLTEGTHCLIVSGGYGLVRPEEPIHYYEAHIQQTASVWRPRLPRVLTDYIRRNAIKRVFVACSSVYATMLGRENNYPWTVEAKETYWYMPRLPRGTGGAQVIVPRRIGEAVVALITRKMVPDQRWQQAIS